MRPSDQEENNIDAGGDALDDDDLDDDDDEIEVGSSSESISSTTTSSSSSSSDDDDDLSSSSDGNENDNEEDDGSSIDISRVLDNEQSMIQEFNHEEEEEEEEADGMDDDGDDGDIPEVEAEVVERVHAGDEQVDTGDEENAKDQPPKEGTAQKLPISTTLQTTKELPRLQTEQPTGKQKKSAKCQSLQGHNDLPEPAEPQHRPPPPPKQEQSQQLEQEIPHKNLAPSPELVEAWKQVHFHLTKAVIVARQSIEAKKRQRRFWLETICNNLTEEGKLAPHSVWKRPASAAPPTRLKARPPAKKAPNTTKRGVKKTTTKGTAAKRKGGEGAGGAGRRKIAGKATKPTSSGAKKQQSSAAKNPRKRKQPPLPRKKIAGDSASTKSSTTAAKKRKKIAKKEDDKGPVKDSTEPAKKKPQLKLPEAAMRVRMEDEDDVDDTEIAVAREVDDLDETTSSEEEVEAHIVADAEVESDVSDAMDSGLGSQQTSEEDDDEAQESLEDDDEEDENDDRSGAEYSDQDDQDDSRRKSRGSFSHPYMMATAASSGNGGAMDSGLGSQQTSESEEDPF